MRINTIVASLAVVIVLPSISIGSSLYMENFEVDPSANWTLNGGPSDEAADFFFDYSTVGIPKATNSALADGTRGMKLQANLSGGIFSGMSASPNGQSFTDVYRVKFDWWANFNGPFPGGGSGSTNLSTFGIGTAGASAQWPGGVQDSIWFGATGDGGSSVDYRAYSPTAGTGYTPPSGVFAAGTSTTPDSRNGADPYYASFGGNSAPAAQTLLFPQQTGSTGAGAPAMRWHEVVIEKSGGNVTWKVNGILLATVPAGDDSVATGNNIFFGHSDINAGSSADVNDAALLFTLIDNVCVVPEPSSIALCLIGVLGLLVGRRRR
ncbi:MAG: PEP-CTERM sorting domain-containing protein [Pirellulales bacterium]